VTARLAASALAVLALAGCALAPVPGLAPACANGQQAMASELLYFGTAMPQGVVSATDWQAFVDAEVTPRFPAGLTTWPAAGQWRGGDGALVREASYVVNIVHAPTPADEAAIGAIVQAYKQRFHQESVLRVSSAACVAF
jgi:hypothetical protein